MQDSVHVDTVWARNYYLQVGKLKLCYAEPVAFFHLYGNDGLVKGQSSRADIIISTCLHKSLLSCWLCAYPQT